LGDAKVPGTASDTSQETAERIFLASLVSEGDSG